MAKKSFFDLFPVPEYLSYPAVGLDLCGYAIKFIEFSRNSGKLKIEKYARRPISETLPSNSPQEQVDEAIINTLIGIKEEFGIRAAHISLPEEHSYFLKLKLPKTEAKEIRSSIELQLEEHVPYSPEEITFDYEVINTLENGEVEIIVSVLPSSVIDRYVNIINRAGITPISFETEAASMMRAVLPQDFTKSALVVDIGKTSSTLSIVSKGIVWFSYTMKTGGALFTKVVSEALSVSEEEAEKIKFNKGLIRSPENQEVLFALAPAISSLRDEIIKHYWYWGAHKEISNQGEIEKVYLCGSQASINGLAEYLSVSLNLPVFLANPWENVFSFEENIPELPLASSLEYVTAIGLALKGVQDNNKK
ncbi:MAG TPA: pilus assembly protein PilM [Candidatus Paceibacterota bacterium]|nr:pilus assembly protein PilM [Candidatus Paceibacterota bacterium]